MFGPLALTAVILAVIAASLFLYMKFFPRAEKAPPPDLRTAAPPIADAPPPAPPAAPPIDLPPLGESDNLVRALVGELSTHPELLNWLARQELVQIAVKVVDNVARGESPRVHLPFLEPVGELTVAEEDAGTMIAQESYQRYDLLASVVSSLDTAAVARLARDLGPLFDQAYDGLGNPDTFDEAFGKACQRVLAVDVSAANVAVDQHLRSFKFSDPRLEDLDDVSKHLLRMGPKNAAKVQEKVRQVKTELASIRGGV